MKFSWQNYNEFKNHIRWHDYLSVMINEFPLVLVRKYDWPGYENDEDYTFVVQILGFKIYQKVHKE